MRTQSGAVTDPLEGAARRRLQVLEAQDLRRGLSLVPKSLHDFCGNDYLGLKQHPSLRAAGSEPCAETGAGASRLVSGHCRYHQDLETALRDHFLAPAALLFNSGYQANCGIIPALTGPDDAVFSDALNHASIIDGIRLSRAQRHVYPHSDMSALSASLKSCNSSGLKVIVSDAVFSMDGDHARLADIVELAHTHAAAVVLDEAHAVGVLGEAGRGLAESLGLSDRVSIRVGTCGKALGSFGAFALCGEQTRELLLNRARSFVYTTALPASVCRVSAAALPLLASGARQEALWENIRCLHSCLQEYGVDLDEPASAVIPIVVGAPAAALELSAALRRRGFLVAAIRPPTVPENSSRLRVTLSAAHTAAVVREFASALAESLRECGVTLTKPPTLT